MDHFDHFQLDFIFVNKQMCHNTKGHFLLLNHTLAWVVVLLVFVWFRYITAPYISSTLEKCINQPNIEIPSTKSMHKFLNFVLYIDSYDSKCDFMALQENWWRIQN